MPELRLISFRKCNDGDEAIYELPPEWRDLPMVMPCGCRHVPRADPEYCQMHVMAFLVGLEMLNGGRSRAEDPDTP